ncbi:hypothetical protein C8P63_12812 [Melghirimyces profundicolus]|uniref:Uncharacterized protein n=1 Tax=Melghirimyces profundicolus TaxID=1242148 RepID=A0A2T6BC33_9BACL|nr:helix-turn-helix domain-containing protein [Melghirimyces profundicolus]PTX53651.1 hypothetical protein C8P63_12812 [Melghirimyces profundicolus]
MPHSHAESNRENPARVKEQWYNLDEAASKLDIPVETIQDLVLTEKLKGMERDGIFWIKEEEMEEARRWVEEHGDEARPVDNRSKEEPEEPVPPQEIGAEPMGEHAEDRPEDPDGLHLMKKSSDSETGDQWRDVFEKATTRLKKMGNPLSHLKFREWIGQFFRMIDEKKRREVRDEQENRQVSVKLGFMTGKNELFCDFCEVNDRFFTGAIFADIYVDGTLKWMMCPNCLNYCRQQANGSMEQNVRARFNQLACRLEREARRARNLAASEDFQVPKLHEWEAWETASMAMQEVATTYPQDLSAFDDPSSFHPGNETPPCEDR